jgi:hypothetical protein
MIAEYGEAGEAAEEQAGRLQQRGGAVLPLLQAARLFLTFS